MDRQERMQKENIIIDTEICENIDTLDMNIIIILIINIIIRGMLYKGKWKRRSMAALTPNCIDPHVSRVLNVSFTCK